MATKAGERPPLHEILWNPTCALDSFPECAAEFDRVWADRYPPGNTAWKKYGEWFKEMDDLSLEILEKAGVIPPVGKGGRRQWPS